MKKASKVAILGSLAAIGVIITLSVGNTTNSFEEVFFVDATYYENSGMVEIVFEDRTGESTDIVLEILGMEESYQKSFTGPAFTESVHFGKPPKYGWKAHPVTFVVQHPEFGKIGIKTEIHPKGEPKPSVIYSEM